jgi:hypothetical protein
MNIRYERLIEFMLFLFIAISICTSVKPVRLAGIFTDNVSFALTRTTSLPPRLIPARSR